MSSYTPIWTVTQYSEEDAGRLWQRQRACSERADNKGLLRGYENHYPCHSGLNPHIPRTPAYTCMTESARLCKGLGK